MQEYTKRYTDMEILNINITWLPRRVEEVLCCYWKPIAKMETASEKESLLQKGAGE